MSTRQSFVRILVAMAIMCGSATTANAQFGGLLKKAKQAVKDKIDTKEYEMKSPIRDKKEDAERNIINSVVGSSVNVKNDDYGSDDYWEREQREAKANAEKAKKANSERKVNTTSGTSKSNAGIPETGEVTIKERKSGKVIGVFDRGTRMLKTNGKTYIFGKDGTVVNSEGTKVGSINGQEMITPTGDKLRCDDIGIVFVDKTNVGSIQNHKMATMSGNIYAEASDKMDQEVFAYLVFGILNNNQKLLKAKNAYEDATMTEKETDEQFYARSNKELGKKFGNSSSGGKGSSDMNLRLGGSIAGRILADGTVYVGGSIKGKIDNSGNIYVGGSIEGTLSSDGDVRKRGHIVGGIDRNGDVRINGSIVGSISNSGEVRKGGSIIGQVEQMSDRNKAAVFYFFGFW